MYGSEEDKHEYVHNRGIRLLNMPESCEKCWKHKVEEYLVNCTKNFHENKKKD